MKKNEGTKKSPTEEMADGQEEYQEYLQRALERLAEARRCLVIVKNELDSATAIDPSLIERLETNISNLEKLIDANRPY